MNINIHPLNANTFNDILLDLKTLGQPGHEQLTVVCNDNQQSFPKTGSFPQKDLGIIYSILSKIGNDQIDKSVALFTIKFLKTQQELLISNPQSMDVINHLQNHYYKIPEINRKFIKLQKIVQLFYKQHIDSVNLFSQLQTGNNKFREKLDIEKAEYKSTVSRQLEREQIDLIKEQEKLKKSTNSSVASHQSQLKTKLENDVTNQKLKAISIRTESRKSRMLELKKQADADYIQQSEALKLVSIMRNSCHLMKPLGYSPIGLNLLNNKVFLGEYVFHIKTKKENVIGKLSNKTTFVRPFVLHSYAGSLFEKKMDSRLKKDNLSIDLTHFPDHLVEALVDILHGKNEKPVNAKDVVPFLILLDYLNLNEIYNDCLQSLTHRIYKDFPLLCEILKNEIECNRIIPQSLEFQLISVFQDHLINNKEEFLANPKNKIFFQVLAKGLKNVWEKKQHLLNKNLLYALSGLFFFCGFGIKKDIRKAEHLFIELHRTSSLGGFFLAQLITENTRFSIKFKEINEDGTSCIVIKSYNDPQLRRILIEDCAKEGFPPAMCQHALNLSKNVWENLQNREFKSINKEVLIAKIKNVNSFKNILAFKWLQKSSRTLYVPSMIALAACYKEGLGTKTDHKAGFDLVSKAVKISDSKLSNYTLGMYYANAIGIGKDLNKAFELFLKAHNQGLQNATFALANCYQHGLGCEIDREKSLELYINLALEGHEGAKAFLNDNGFE